jgi:Peptidase_C39 like family
VPPPPRTIRSTIASAVAVASALLLAAPLVAIATAAVAAPAREASQISYVAWDSAAQLATGTSKGVAVTGDQVVLSTPAPGRRTLGSTSYETGRWRSPWVTGSFAFSELIASWEATTTKRSFVDIEVRGRSADGGRASWDTLARWATTDRRVRRTTFSGQADDLASVATDTWRAGGAGLLRWQVRVTLARKAGTRAPVTVGAIGAVTSRVSDTAPPTSAPGVAAGVTLDVPAYSQMTHRGHFPQWGGGGEAWCSPTSLAMVLGYYGALPDPASYPWVPAGHADPWVDAVARATYDHGYDGTGNWPFNTAYAASRTGSAFVTRLPSLAEAERFVAAGIPLVASIAFGRGELTGAPISASDGHLMVIAGFTATGDVVVNDPAAATDATVRRTYQRAQLERLWLEASGGLVYVVHDPAHPLPSSPGSRPTPMR